MFRTVTDCMQNGHHFLSSLLLKQSNSHVHEALEIIFFTGYVISSVVNITPEKYNVSELSIFLRSKMKKHWVRNGLYGYVQVEFLNFCNFLFTTE